MPVSYTHLIYHIRSFTKEKKADGTIEAATYHLAPVMARLFQDAGGAELKSVGVLDERIATYNAGTGVLTMKREGRTMVYALSLIHI